MPVKAAPFTGIYQSGFVTTDLKRAVKSMSELHGIGPFAEFKDVPFQTIEGRDVRFDLAFAYVGAHELEVIQPLSGDAGVWRDALPKSGYALRPHHLCWYYEDADQYEAMRARMMAEYGPLPVDSEGAFGRVFYADCRATVGHYMEGIWASDMLKEMKVGIPHY